MNKLAILEFEITALIRTFEKLFYFIFSTIKILNAFILIRVLFIRWVKLVSNYFTMLKLKLILIL